MILGYGARNCWCFKDWMEVDLELDNNVPKDISMNLPAATAMCFKGANASGKTNGLKIITFIRLFATESFILKPEDRIPYAPFFDNDEESEFYIRFCSDTACYRYEVTMTTANIEEERIYRKNNVSGSRETLVFERNSKQIIKNTLYKGHSDISLRTNASIISTLHQYEIEEISDIYKALKGIYTNVSFHGMNYQGAFDHLNVSKYLYENSDMLKQVSNIITRFDTGIESIRINKVKDENNNDIYIPVFYHIRENERSYPMHYDDESSGTKRLYVLLMYYLDALRNGELLIFDEFDTNLHPDILPYLLNMFIVKKNNPNNAQIIFTTHSNKIMDILGRYRTYIFEKTNGESICYRVDEINSSKLRNDRPISVPYENKLLGGVPIIAN